MCELYLDPDVNGVRMAMVEQVGTLIAYRERGLAKAAVSAAIRAAADWGAELLTVPADQDHWPQVIYAGLGFAPAGVQIHFTHRDPSALQGALLDCRTWPQARWVWTSGTRSSTRSGTRRSCACHGSPPA